MKKFSLFFFLIFSLFIISLIRSYFFFTFSLNYFRFSFLFNNYDFIISLDPSSFIFLCIVFFVTCLVSLYSEFYMEHYNNKKFFFILILFLSSIIILSLRGSFLILMVGWDGLGLSSICLIIFYPNKITLYNSFLTIFFNRLGDVLIILSLRIILSNFYFIFFCTKFRFFLCVILILCSFRKRAQFPLSCWLPAAISAPTPISAIVHSSTLVTAGIFLVQKIVHNLRVCSTLDFLVCFSILTFLIGGIIANIEIDFKKVVAFSTIRQIRMIIFFCASNFIFLALMHIFFHAFFKTLLFCCSGVLFVSIFRDQFKVLIKYNFSINFILVIVFMSLFRMRGLIFSSSFFRKDLILENFLTYNISFFQIFLILGSLLTLFYCVKLACSLFS